MGPGLRRVVPWCLAAVLLAQAVVVIVDEPWPEGRILWRLSRDHGVVVGDIPAVALVCLGMAVALWCQRPNDGPNRCSMRWRSLRAPEQPVGGPLARPLQGSRRGPA